MATRIQLRNHLRRRITRGSEFTDADYDQWLNDGLLDLGTRRIVLRELQSIGTPITSVVATAGYTIPPTAFSLLYLEDTTNSRILDRWPGTYESYLKARQQEAPTIDTIPAFFIEFGSQFFVFETPQVATINWTPYFYDRPVMASGDNATPNINEEWHYAIEILAAQHAFIDIGDDERGSISVQEFQAWLGQRDTSRRQTDRFNTPTRGARPHGSWLRTRRRLGV